MALAGQAGGGNGLRPSPLTGGGGPAGEVRPLHEVADIHFGSAVSVSGSTMAARLGALWAAGGRGLPEAAGYLVRPLRAA